MLLKDLPSYPAPLEGLRKTLTSPALISYTRGIMKKRLGRQKGKAVFVQMGDYDPKTFKRTNTKFSVIYNVSHAKLKRAIEDMLDGLNK